MSVGQRTLVERWDGTSWSIVPSPNPHRSASASLSGVSCVSTTDCVAVGAYYKGLQATGGALVEQWDGMSWSIVATPTPKLSRETDPLDGVLPSLDGVSCSSVKSCVAVGFTATDALVEQWNGTAWSIVGTPSPPVEYVGDGIAELRGVSCVSATNCSAVGAAYSRIDLNSGPGLARSIVEHWDGHRWSIAARPNAVPTTDTYNGQLSELNGVSCSSATTCAAVGNSALVERWDGTRWSMAPFTGSTSNSRLDQVSCPNPTTCFAVGSSASIAEAGFGTTVFHDRTLVEQWDGTSWPTIPSPTPARNGFRVQNLDTNDISCPSPTDCTAVGTYYLQSSTAFNEATLNPLVEHWNGTRWSIVPTPNPDPTNAEQDYGDLYGVSCPTATSCMAVGQYTTRGPLAPTHSYIQHWNGTRWSIVPTSNPTNTRLYAVSCSTATTCIAVGASAANKPLAQRWNDNTWSTLPTANPTDSVYGPLTGVSCPTLTDCTAVGYDYPLNPRNNGHTVSFSEHWDGTTWTILTSPNPTDATDTRLSRVSCPNTTTCTAIGIYFTTFPENVDQPLLEQWDGTSWTIVPTPIPANATATDLNGIACPSATTCTAVGNDRSGNDSYTLTEQGPEPSPDTETTPHPQRTNRHDPMSNCGAGQLLSPSEHRTSKVGCGLRADTTASNAAVTWTVRPGSVRTTRTCFLVHRPRSNWSWSDMPHRPGKRPAGPSGWGWV